jgi:hypothetical protein
MEANQFLGLIKFFHNPEYLELLLDGCVHCQTPEIYRRSSKEGQGDRNESCVMSWRQCRGDADIELHINGHHIPISDLEALTVQREGGDSWLTCWFCLRLPELEQDVETLKADLARMKQEFGRHYAFVPAYHASAFLDRIKQHTDKPVWAQEVAYKDESIHWSARCKSTAYRYQREYRIGFGECAVSETSPYVFHCDGGFRDLILANVEIQLVHNDTGQVFLDVGSI